MYIRVSSHECENDLGRIDLLEILDDIDNTVSDLRLVQKYETTPKKHPRLALMVRRVVAINGH